MEPLAIPLLAACYLVTGLYALVATGVAACCLVAVGVVLVRRLGADAVDIITYGS